MHATCSTHPVLDLITLIFGKEYKLWSLSLCNFCYLPVTSSLLGLNILFGTSFLYILSLYLLCIKLNAIKHSCWSYIIADSVPK